MALEAHLCRRSGSCLERFESSLVLEASADPYVAESVDLVACDAARPGSHAELMVTPLGVRASEKESGARLETAAPYRSDVQNVSSSYFWVR